MNGKFLGVIKRAQFGFGGYQDVQFGLTLEFFADGYGCVSFTGTWADPPTKHAQWTLEDQSKCFADACRLLADTLQKAKKRNVGELVGVPVEVTFAQNTLASWRVLTEVIA